MADLTREEFAALCKTTTGIVNTNVSRGKITVLASKKIDTENVLNAMFKKKYLRLYKEKQSGTASAKPAQTKKETFVKAPTFKAAIESVADELDISEEEIEEIFSQDQEEAPKTPKRKSNREEQNAEDQEKVNLDLRKKIADVSAAESKAEREQLQLEKMLGSLMPVNIVEAIVRINVQHIFKTFEEDLINIASIYTDILADGDRGKLAELVLKMRGKLSEVIERTKKTAAQEIENAIGEYAETRNRGERK